MDTSKAATSEPAFRAVQDIVGDINPNDFNLRLNPDGIPFAKDTRIVRPCRRRLCAQGACCMRSPLRIPTGQVMMTSPHVTPNGCLKQQPKSLFFWLLMDPFQTSPSSWGFAPRCPQLSKKMFCKDRYRSLETEEGKKCIFAAHKLGEANKGSGRKD